MLTSSTELRRHRDLGQVNKDELFSEDLRDRKPAGEAGRKAEP